MKQPKRYPNNGAPMWLQEKLHNGQITFAAYVKQVRALHLNANY